jgi:hypothetical protein
VYAFVLFKFALDFLRGPVIWLQLVQASVSKRGGKETQQHNQGYRNSVQHIFCLGLILITSLILTSI